MSVIKTVGRSGQISLGKEYAGQTVMIEELGCGTWLIKSGMFIPDAERWLYEPKIKAEIDESIAWAEKTPPAESSLLEREP